MSKTVSVRDLRNQGGRVLDEVAGGTTMVVTKDGRPVAELHPLSRRGLSALELVKRRRHLPDMDLGALRRELDTAVDM